MMISSPWRDSFWGVGTRMRTNYGCTARAYLDNAAAPQVAEPAALKIRRALPRYACGGGPDRLSEEMREKCEAVRAAVLDYVGGDPEKDAAVFTSSATAAVNLLSSLLRQADPGQVVITTRMEHLADFLPFRERFHTALVEMTADGKIDLDDYRRLLVKYEGKAGLVAVTAGSNVTGVVPPVHRMAELAHEYGAKILVDAAQAVQHRPFSMRPHADRGHLDFLVFSGRKCYAGRAGGVLVGPKEFLNSFRPALYGAGVADFVSDEEIAYREAPARYEAGGPDCLGVLALGEALRFLKKVGLARIAEYEGNLYRYLLRRLREVPGVVLYGAPDEANHLPIAAFNLQGVSFRDLGDALGYDYGVAVAAGTCGADLCVQDLLKLSDAQACALFRNGRGYGVVRASLAPFNSSDDVDRLANALRRVAGG